MKTLACVTAVVFLSLIIFAGFVSSQYCAPQGQVCTQGACGEDYNSFKQCQGDVVGYMACGACSSGSGTLQGTCGASTFTPIANCASSGQKCASYVVQIGENRFPTAACVSPQFCSMASCVPSCNAKGELVPKSCRIMELTQTCIWGQPFPCPSGTVCKLLRNGAACLPPGAPDNGYAFTPSEPSRSLSKTILMGIILVIGLLLAGYSVFVDGP